jgi:AraC-like DNA-binding protein
LERRKTVAQEIEIMCGMGVFVGRAGEDSTAPRSARAGDPVALAILDARQGVGEGPWEVEMVAGLAISLLKPVPAASVSSAATPFPGLAAWQVRKVTRYVAENIDRPLGNGDLAALASLSANHFSRMFKRSLGVSPHEYVVQSRLHHARALMLRTPLSLSQIALESGFCDQAHMCRTFHRAVGSTPSDWRRANSQASTQLVAQARGSP